jgi:uncharacterized surface protein with fasciclin (FAS1) repeats
LLEPPQLPAAPRSGHGIHQQHQTLVDARHLADSDVVCERLHQRRRLSDAGLVCGGINTANATVYMIDTVLMPPGQ